MIKRLRYQLVRLAYCMARINMVGVDHEVIKKTGLYQDEPKEDNERIMISIATPLQA